MKPRLLASVIQYFGTKQGLFREAVHWQIPIGELTTDDPARTVENCLRAMFGAWSEDPNSPWPCCCAPA
ncbi:hypothetical protein GCM10023080_053460 [Streptomyces pseudoechinosporeus]